MDWLRVGTLAPSVCCSASADDDALLESLLSGVDDDGAEDDWVTPAPEIAVKPAPRVLSSSFVSPVSSSQASGSCSQIPWFALPALLFLQFTMAFNLDDDNDSMETMEFRPQATAASRYGVQWSTVNVTIVLFLLVSFLFKLLLHEKHHYEWASLLLSFSADEPKGGYDLYSLGRQHLHQLIVMSLPDIIMDVLLALVFCDKTATAVQVMVVCTTILTLYVLSQWRLLLRVLLKLTDTNHKQKAASSLSSYIRLDQHAVRRQQQWRERVANTTNKRHPAASTLLLGPIQEECDDKMEP